MRVLFIANTAFALIVSCCIKKVFYSNDEADIVISDTILNGENIFQRMCHNNHLFSRRFFVNNQAMLNRANDIDKVKEKQDAMQRLEQDFQENYDAFFCHAGEPFSVLLYNYLKNKNSCLDLYWYVDGLATYTVDGENFVHKNTLHIKAKKLFLFNPELFKWEFEAEKVKIPKICDILDDEFQGYLNDIFNYGESLDAYKEKFIFFEDGYDDLREKDIQLLHYIASIVKKENIIVKQHPRVADAILRTGDFTVNKSLNIPFECVAMNRDLSDKVLITMYSQAAITPHVLFNQIPWVIILSELTKDFTARDKLYYDFMKKYYLNTNERVIIPRSLKELRVTLEKLNKIDKFYTD